MEGISTATVHLALPEEELFSERQKPVTASVLVATTRELNESEVEAITYLVSSSVEGLDVSNITVADARGLVLHAPGEATGSSSVTNRHQRQTREFEDALGEDVSRLLASVTNGTAPSVVVRAILNYDENETQTETYDEDNQVILKEQTSAEEFEGTGVAPGGIVGVDGGPIPGAEGGESLYNREDALREFGVDKVVSRNVTAPGRVERLSVAVVMDDGTLTGANVPALAEVEALVQAAVGLEAERGDTIAVSLLPLPAPEEIEVVEEPEPGLMDLLPQIVAALVLLFVAIALFLMSRRRKTTAKVIETVPTPSVPTVAQMIEEPVDETREEARDLQRDVAQLVERQPEEIATLLRGWLADRRSA
jgi:flagellar M-ring protein FliF